MERKEIMAELEKIFAEALQEEQVTLTDETLLPMWRDGTRCRT